MMFPEYKRFLEALHKDKYYSWELYAIVSFCTACRVSDVLRLRWCDVLGGKDCIIKEQKTGKTRRIPINPSNKATIMNLYKLLGNPPMDELMFIGKDGKKHVTTQSVNRNLKKFKEMYNLKVDNFSTHSLRKTFGRYVYDSNGHSAESLLLLNHILKHSNIETTKIYIGITQDEVNSVFSNIHL